MAKEPNASSMPSNTDASFLPSIPVTIEAASPSPGSGHTTLPPAAHPDDDGSTAAVGDEPKSSVVQTKTQLQHGTIGFVRKVSCGTFDKDNRFETAWTWSYDRWKGRKEFSYMAEVWPRRFSVCLPCSNQAGRSKEEWMDIHETNIRGLIFEQQKEDHEESKAVCFVIGKPPQFYERKDLKAAIENPSRIPYPSTIPVTEDSPSPCDSPLVCGIPWEIQYSRVYRVEFSERQKFNLDTYERPVDRLKRKCFPAGPCRVEASGRGRSDMIKLFGENIRIIHDQSFLEEKMCEYEGDFGMRKLPAFTSSTPFTNEVCICILQLLHNCTVSATSEEARTLTFQIYRHYQEKIYSNSLMLELLNRVSHDTKMTDERALTRLLTSSGPPLDDTAIDLFQAFQSHFGESPAGTLDSLNAVTFEALIFPSHVELHGPITTGNSLIMDTYRQNANKFLRVRFVDNDMRPMKSEAKVQIESIVSRRVVDILQGGVQILLNIGLQYQFLGYSMSSLKKRKAVWFYRENLAESASTIRDGIGNWDDSNRNLADKPSKWGARISLAFTTSHKATILDRDEWDHQPDEPPNHPFPNTDGCGMISETLCKAIHGRLPVSTTKRARAFQIRCGGVKGVVYVAADSLLKRDGKQKQMILRKSQIKVVSPDDAALELRIVSSTHGAERSLFFDSALKAFEDSGADTKKIEEIFDRTYEELASASPSGIDHLQHIFRVRDDYDHKAANRRHHLLRLAIELKQQPLTISPEQYSESFLALYLTKLGERVRDTDMFKIPIPGSYNVLGLSDDYGILERTQVIVRAHGRTIHGTVLLYRDPIIHIGDIQIAKALTEEEITAAIKKRVTDLRRAFETNTDDRRRAREWIRALLHPDLDNVIFFSKHEQPSLPNQLSGGDLDGDRFEVVTKECGFLGPKYTTSPPANYADNELDSQTKAGRCSKPFDIDAVASFIGDYIRNDCFDILQERLMCMADQKEGGMKNNDVKKLSPWLSKAVDYAKSGTGVNLESEVLNERDFNIWEEKPDFVRALRRKAFYDGVDEDNSSGEIPIETFDQPHGSEDGYYESPHLLGRIYRNINAKRFRDVWKCDNFALSRALPSSHTVCPARSLRHYHATMTPSTLPSGNKSLQRWSVPVEACTSSTCQRPNYDDSVTRVVLSEMRHYRAYLETRKIEEKTEHELFLDTSNDGFADTFVERLISRILNDMRSVSSNGQVSNIRSLTEKDLEATREIYKYCLWRAWETATLLSNWHPDLSEDDQWPDKFRDSEADPNSLLRGGLGQSYAFICLYAVFFGKLSEETIYHVCRYMTEGWNFSDEDE